MDPITVVGFAASIVTFIDFSHKIISATSEVFSTRNTAENAHVSAVVNDLRGATKGLNHRPPGYSKHDEALNILAAECEGICDELCKLLDQVKVKVGTSRWQSAKVALRSMRTEKEVAHLEERVGKCRSQILLRLVLLLNEETLHIQVQLNHARSRSQKQASDTVKQLTRLRDDVLRALEVTDQHINDFVSAKFSEQLHLLKDVHTALNRLLTMPSIPSPEIRILKQLYFTSLHSREDAVRGAEYGTFEWLVHEDLKITGQHGDDSDDGENGNMEGDDDKSAEFYEELQQSTRHVRLHSCSAFLSWLRSDGGVFHISGKAGSGKSTLMKLLLGHSRTLKELKTWAGSKHLLFAHFFFWRVGGDLQRSLEGLYRSLLFEVLRRSPELTRAIFPEAYETFSVNDPGMTFDQLYFRPPQLERAMEALISKSPYPGHRICLFIDGLDEYGDGSTDSLDHERLAQQLQSWAAKNGVKILVSSRPHREFEGAFSDDRRIRLHKLNELDIFRFARDMFEKYRHISRVQDSYMRLVETVVRDSGGVFLWARLAVRSLIMAVRRNSSISYLEKQLKGMPKGFDDLYNQILMSVHTADRITTIKLLLLVVESHKVNAIAVTWIDSLDDDTFPTSYDIRPYTKSEIQERQAAAESQLDYFGKGLLEISGSPDSPDF